MKKQPEWTAQTRQNLIDAFWQLYSVRSIDKITVKEIAAKAGYNRGTFYEYFADVYDVLEQIEDGLLSEMQTLPPQQTGDAAGGPPAIDTFVRMYEKNRKYFVVLFGDSGDPSFQSRIKDRLKPLLRGVLGASSAVDDFELDYTLEYLLSAMIGVLSHWFLRQDAPPDLRLLELMNRLTRHGVLPAQIDKMLYAE